MKDTVLITLICLVISLFVLVATMLAVSSYERTVQAQDNMIAIHKLENR